MSIFFEWYETPDPTGERKETLLHPRPAMNGEADSKEISRMIEHACSLTRADVAGALAALSEAIGDKLSRGQRVHLDGIGTFQVSLTVAGEEVNPDTRFKTRKVRVRGINFQPDGELLHRLKQADCEHIRTGRRSQSIADEEVNRCTEAYLEENGYLFRRDLERICGLTTTTAWRHLKRMKEEGLIEVKGVRTQPMYIKKQ